MESICIEYLVSFCSSPQVKFGLAAEGVGKWSISLLSEKGSENKCAGH